MAGSDSTYGSDLNKLIIELQYRVGALESLADSAKSFINNQETLATPTGLGVAGKYVKWASDNALTTATVISESGSVLTVTGDIVSDANNTRDIGTPGNFFANTYSVNVAASAIAVDTLGDAAAGFIELADVPFQPATSGGASLGISGKEFSEVWGLDGHFDSLDVATAGFIEQRATIQPDSDLAWDLGTDSLRYDGVFSQAFALDTLTFLTFGSAATPNGAITASPGAMYASTTGGASATFWVKETGTNTNTGWIAYGAAGAGGANTALSNLTNPTNINQSLISQGDGLSGPANNLGSAAHHWNDEYVVRLLNTGTGNIDIQANLRPDTGPGNYDIGAAGGHEWSSLYVSQYPSRIFFSQAGTTPSIATGSTAPNGTVTADIGSLYLHKTGAAGAVLWVKETLNASSSGWTAVNPTGTSPPGSDQQIVYNNSGGFAADANLVWDYTNHQFQVGGSGAIIYTSGQFWGADGSAATPSYAFQHATDGLHMGFFRHAANSIGISTSSTEVWRIDSNGNLLSPVDNDHDIGQNGLFRPKHIYAGTEMKTPLLTAPHIGNAGTAVSFDDSLQSNGNDVVNCGSSVAGGGRFANVYGNAFRFDVALNWTHGTGAPSAGFNTGSIYSREDGTAGNTLYVREAGSWNPVGGAGAVPGSLGNVIFNGGGTFAAVNAFGWDSSTNTLTVQSSGPGNGIIGTTGVNSQIISRGIITTADGSAGAPGYAFNTGLAMGFFKSAANQMDIATSGAARWRVDSNGFLKAVSDNSVDIGASGLFRPRSIYAGTSVRTPRVDGNGVAVQFGDSLQSLGNDVVNCGSALAQNGRFANVYGKTFSFDADFGLMSSAGSPNGVVQAKPGSLCLDSTVQLWQKTSGTGTSGWTVFGATGGGADLQLSNLSGTTAVPVDLLPAGTGLRQLGSSTHKWGGCQINSVGTNSLSSLTSVITLFSSLEDGGGVNIGSFANNFASMFATNLAVTNIVPLSGGGTGIAIGQGSDPVYIILGGVAKRITTNPSGAIPLYVA
jgi:hypothetical protein